MTRKATVYMRRQQFLIHALSKTTDGVWILSEPCSALAIECDDRGLGTAIRRTLEGSLPEVPHPSSWNKVFEPMLRLAGVKTWKAFATGSACIQIETDGNQVVLIPQTNRGPKEGFEPDLSRAATLESASAEELGRIGRQLLVEGNRS
jgi:hypothetical protein